MVIKVVVTRIFPYCEDIDISALRVLKGYAVIDDLWVILWEEWVGLHITAYE